MTSNRGVPGDRVSAEDTDVINERFRIEARQYNFQYQCGSCLHDNPEEKLCSMKYPRGKDGRYGHKIRGDRGELLFCKYFELN